MTGVALLWAVSVALSAISIMVMCGLIVVRVVSLKSTETALSEERALAARLIKFTGVGDEEAMLSILKASQPKTVIKVAFDFMQMVRGEEAEKVRAVLQRSGLPDYIRRQLRSSRVSMRVHAAELLQLFPAPSTRTALLRALRDAHPEVRLAAAIGLLKLGYQDRLRDLLELVGPTAQHSARVFEMFNNAPPQAYSELLKIAADPRMDDFVRSEAIRAMATKGDLSFLAALKKLSTDASPVVAAAAVEALGRLGHPTGVSDIRRALESDIWELRAAAAEAMGRGGFYMFAHELGSLLHDPEWVVQYAAAKALARLGAEGQKQLEIATTSGPVADRQKVELMLKEARAN
ncbi:MAG: HEAT repeat domain-containing protein [Rhodobacteraceae bacterium]|nr:HEAT repeat domain-containing protein [Paracoccaceae bacterium]